MDSKLSNQDKIKFNAYYDKANELINGKLKNKNNLNNLSIMDKIELAESIALFKECLKINSNSWQSMWAIGLAYQMLGENEESLEWLNNAFMINPSLKK